MIAGLFTIILQSSLLLFTFVSSNSNSSFSGKERLFLRFGVAVCFTLSVTFSAFGFFDSMTENTREEIYQAAATRIAGGNISLGGDLLAERGRELRDEIAGTTAFDAWRKAMESAAAAASDAGPKAAKFAAERAETLRADAEAMQAEVNGLQTELGAARQQIATLETRIEAAERARDPLLENRNLHNAALQEARAAASGQITTYGEDAAPLEEDGIRQLQEVLKGLEFYGGAIDGVSGSATRAAVQALLDATGAIATVDNRFATSPPVLKRAKALEDQRLAEARFKASDAALDKVSDDIARLKGELAAERSKQDALQSRLASLTGGRGDAGGTGPQTGRDSLNGIDGLVAQISAGIRRDSAAAIDGAVSACSQVRSILQNVGGLRQEAERLRCPPPGFNFSDFAALSKDAAQFEENCISGISTLGADFPDARKRFEHGRRCLADTGLSSAPSYADRIRRAIQSSSESERTISPDASVHSRFSNAITAGATEAWIGLLFALFIDGLIVVLGVVSNLNRVQQVSYVPEPGDNTEVATLKQLFLSKAPPATEGYQGDIELTELDANITAKFGPDAIDHLQLARGFLQAMVADGAASYVNIAAAERAAEPVWVYRLNTRGERWIKDRLAIANERLAASRAQTAREAAAERAKVAEEARHAQTATRRNEPPPAAPTPEISEDKTEPAPKPRRDDPAPDRGRETGRDDVARDARGTRGRDRDALEDEVVARVKSARPVNRGGEQARDPHPRFQDEPPPPSDGPRLGERRRPNRRPS